MVNSDLSTYKCDTFSTTFSCQQGTLLRVKITLTFCMHMCSKLLPAAKTLTEFILYVAIGYRDVLDHESGQVS